MGVPVDDKILVRTHNTAPMKNLNNQERYNNLKNAFKLKDIKKNYNNYGYVQKTIRIKFICNNGFGDILLYYYMHRFR